MLVIGLGFNILVCFAVPIVGMLIVKKKWGGKWSLFLIGALAFFVSQLCLRMPLLGEVLPQFAWFHVMQRNPWLNGLFLGVTAALFEESARWICFALLKRRGKLPSGQTGAISLGQAEAVSLGQAEAVSLGQAGAVSLGLGHGGFEAMLVGLNNVVLLFMALSGLSGMISAGTGAVFAAGIERLFTMAFHVGLTLLILYGVQTGKSGRYFGLAVALHTISDAAVIIFPAVFGIGMVGMELWIAGMACLALGMGLYPYRRRTEGKAA